MLRGASDEAPINVVWRDRQSEKPATLPVGLLKKEIMKITSGRKIAYVVDCSFTNGNIERVVRLAQGSDILFIETTFHDVDAALAASRRHLTARGKLERSLGSPARSGS